MRPRKLKISVSLSGMHMPIATVTIKKFADILEPKTELICPRCLQKPSWNGGYTCTCCPICGKPMEAVVVNDKGIVNFKCAEHGRQDPSFYKHWSQLKRVLPNGEEVVKPKLTTGEDVEAEAYIMDKSEFSKYADATLTEYGCVVKDETSARNLKKLLIALTNLNKVILLHYNDTYEERICILTLSLSNRIILKELIPQNLADIAETMKVDLSQITEKDIAEAEAFIKMLPKAEESLLYVSDYRTIGIEATRVSPKVLELETLFSKLTKEKASA